MDRPRFRFASFTLDPANRRLQSGGKPVELNARYLDALVLLVAAGGDLVTKERFHDEVWRGVPVTDEALTQCIRTLRRLLGDDAVRPRFIATVPKHGYRFVAPVAVADGACEVRPIASQGARRMDWPAFVAIAGGGTLGGIVTGLIGGLAYGLDATAQPLQPGIGVISTVLVLVAVTTLVATVGAAGVALGIAVARMALRGVANGSIVGGALGGLVIGAFAKLLGVDAFELLFGQSPGDITGGAEGIVLGGATGLACWLGLWRSPSLSARRGLGIAAAIGGAAGLAIPLLGGRMMGGSLALLADHFPGSRLDFAQLGRFFGESDFGPVSRTVTGGLEGALFAACIVGGILFVERRLSVAGAASLRQP